MDKKYEGREPKSKLHFILSAGAATQSTWLKQNEKIIHRHQ